MHRRSVVLVVLAAVVALLVSGCAQAAVPVDRAATATVTPTPTPTAAAAPSLRVPTTCDQLVPASALASGFRTAVVAQTIERPHNPAWYADERVGALSCRWESPERSPGANDAAVSAWVVVVPGATSQAIEDQNAGAFGPGIPLDGGTDGFRFCSPQFFQMCAFFARVGDYGISGGVWDYGDATYASQSSAVRALESASIPLVAGLSAPVALWQPASATLRGAADCDGLLTPEQLSAATGWQGVSAVKSDGGENAASTLEANKLVGSYYCTFGEERAEHIAAASVLPGGASFALATRPADAVDVAGLGTSAYRSGDGIDIIADSGWVRVSGSLTDAQLIAIGRQVLANVSG